MRNMLDTAVGRFALAGMGVWLLALGVSSFLGWPTPYETSQRWFLLVLCLSGLIYLWMAVRPKQQLARRIVIYSSAVVTLVLYVADAPLPF